MNATPQQEEPGCTRPNQGGDESEVKLSNYTDIRGKDEGASRQKEVRMESNMILAR